MDNWNGYTEPLNHNKVARPITRIIVEERVDVGEMLVSLRVAISKRARPWKGELTMDLGVMKESQC